MARGKNTQSCQRIVDDAFFVESREQTNQESRKALRTAFENLLEEGHRDLYHQVGGGQPGYDGEGTVDGTHPTDLGFWRQTQVYVPQIENVLDRANAIVKNRSGERK